MNINLLTVDEVAAVLRCSPRHVRELLYADRIRSVLVGARARRVREEDLEEFLRHGLGRSAKKAPLKIQVQFRHPPVTDFDWSKVKI